MMTRRKTRSSLNREEENSEKIPLDLIIEILMKLPVKSIARFRCISKLWGSTLGSTYFTKSFLTISSSRPKLLFTCRKYGRTFFFTSSAPQNSSTLTVDFHMSFPINFYCRPVCGLVCGLNYQWTLNNGNTVTETWICNPSTGQSLTLPKLIISSKRVKSYLGYDPIDKQFKVLSMTDTYSKEHPVLTVGTEKKLSWRMIKCDIPHYPAVLDPSRYQSVYDDICIHGVLYYLSWVPEGECYEIVCFEIRSEKFKRIKKAQGMVVISISTLLNHKGKLATFQSEIVNAGSIQLWVLEDADNHQWSSYIYEFPPPWKNITEKTTIYLVGMTSRGEIVLSQNCYNPEMKSSTKYLLYYNPEMKSITKAEIRGMEDFTRRVAFIFLDHVEDMKLMESVYSIMDSS